jgi:hypothetical protein
MKNWLIEGITEDGRRFRPSDWVDRLSSALGSFGPDQRLRYGLVRPYFHNGQKCLLVNKCLENDNPGGFEYVCGFARANGLRMSDFEEQPALAG